MSDSENAQAKEQTEGQQHSSRTNRTRWRIRHISKFRSTVERASEENIDNGQSNEILFGDDETIIRIPQRLSHEENEDETDKEEFCGRNLLPFYITELFSELKIEKTSEFPEIKAARQDIQDKPTITRTFQQLEDCFQPITYPSCKKRQLVHKLPHVQPFNPLEELRNLTEKRIKQFECYTLKVLYLISSLLAGYLIAYCVLAWLTIFDSSFPYGIEKVIKRHSRFVILHWCFVHAILVFSLIGFSLLRYGNLYLIPALVSLCFHILLILPERHIHNYYDELEQISREQIMLYLIFTLLRAISFTVCLALIVTSKKTATQILYGRNDKTLFLSYGIAISDDLVVTK